MRRSHRTIALCFLLAMGPAQAEAAAVDRTAEETP